MGKIKLKSSYKNANRKKKEDDGEEKDAKAEELTELIAEEDDGEVEPKGKQKSGLVKRVRFKVAKRLNALGTEGEATKSVLKKKKASAQKAKLDEIKKQINSAVANTTTDGTNPLYKVVSQARLTNTLLKTALSKSEDGSSVVSKDKLNRILAKSNLTKKDLVGGVKKLDKKSKSKIKKQFWHDRIDTIKGQLKANSDKAKREKTVIVGDMKPIIESLGVKVSEPAKNAKATTVTFDLTTSSAPSKREKHEKNLEREKGKSVPKQSVRQKQSNEDLQLFSQLQGYSEFTSNPLEILKKHFNSNPVK